MRAAAAAVVVVAAVSVGLVGGALISLPHSTNLIEDKTVDYQPQQIHIAIGETNRDIVVTWVTPDNTNGSFVNFGTDGLNQQANGSAQLFTDGGVLHRSFWIHRVALTDLLPDTRYFYHCGSDVGWSELFTFKTWKNGTDWPVSLAIYGDLGAVNAQSLAWLQVETQKGMYHAILHVGDFAYDMDTDNAKVGDEFMRQIQPIAAYVPYMTCPGNHEQQYNFSNYRARFSMPRYEDTENLFFSWNMGQAHFISINTEAYYFLQYGLKPLSRQYQWLIEDLKQAALPEVRAERPWIIVFGHRPMYCSNNDHDDCTKVNCLTRVGLPLIHVYAMEELLDNFGVDLAIWAHEHSYERLWPMYNFTVLNGSLAEPYTNPRGPVHVTTGSAGCSEDHDFFMPDQPYWSAVRSVDYGYTRLTIHNNTHLYWEQMSVEKDGELIDSVMLIRDKHVSYKEIRGEE